MIRVAFDNPPDGRLLLRAAPATGRRVAQRVVASLFALVATVVGIVGPIVGLHPVSWFVSAPLGLLVAYALLQMPAPEVEEIGVDRVTRTLWWSVRGNLCWARARYAHPLPAAGVCLRLRAGSVPPGGLRHPELGLALHGPRGAISPNFVIAGIDRRAEARAFAELLARRLDLRVTCARDDVGALEVILGTDGDLPSPEVLVGGGFREPAVSPGLDTSRRRSFEAPSTLPPPLSSDTAITGKLTLDDGQIVLEGPSWRARAATLTRSPWWAGFVCGSGLLGGFLGSRQGAAARGFALGLGAATALIGVMWLIPWVILHGGFWALRLFARALGAENDDDPGIGPWLEPRRVLVDATAVAVRSHWREQRFARAAEGADDARVVLLVGGLRDPANARSLWLWSGSRWVFLARSRGAHTALGGLAIAVARALDVSIRASD